jgi:hypothetical protein
MKRVTAGVLSAFVFATFPVASNAADQCPAEVSQAKAMLNKQARGQEQQAPRSLAGARIEQQAPRGQEVQAPRSLAGARVEQQAPRSQVQQAPRGQEQQAPRGQEQQAPRGQEQQAPRGQEQQAPRGQEQQAPRGDSKFQAPRGQEQQAPRGQEQQAPRGQEQQAPRSLAGAKATSDSTAAKLVREAEAACKAGDMKTAKAKAEAALAEMK